MTKIIMLINFVLERHLTILLLLGNISITTFLNRGLKEEAELSDPPVLPMYVRTSYDFMGTLQY